jgi:hypothetical protein
MGPRYFDVRDGHYLGPAFDACKVMAKHGAKGNIKIVRFPNPFLSDNEEGKILGLASDTIPCFEYVSSRPSFLSKLDQRSQGFFVLQGGHVTNELACAVKSLPILSPTGLAVHENLVLDKLDLIIAIGIRGGSRQLVGLEHLILEVHTGLLDQGFSRMGYILDGLCDSTGDPHPTTSMLSMAEELEIASRIELLLPKDSSFVKSVIGLRLSKQLEWLSKCHLAIGHRGSSSAKYMWMLALPTIVHTYENAASPPLEIAHMAPIRLDVSVGYRGAQHPPEFYISNDLVVAHEEESSMFGGGRKNYRPVNISDMSLCINALIKRLVCDKLLN